MSNNTNNITIEIKDFKAIEEASIVLDGITVLSGVNSSGKSTLARLLYYSFYHSDNYAELAERSVKKLLEIYARFLGETANRHFIESDQPISVEGAEFDTFASLIKINYSSLEKAYNYVQDLNNQLLKNYEGYNWEIEVPDQKALEKITKQSYNTRDEYLSGLRNYVDVVLISEVRKYKETLKVRPTHLLSDALFSHFEGIKVPDLFQIEEWGEVIISTHKTNALPFRSLHRVFYIDTPMSLNIDPDNALRLVPSSLYPMHWQDLFKQIYNSDKGDFIIGDNETLYSQIFSVIDGKVNLEKLDGLRRTNIYYEDVANDIKVSIREAASGIKSFAIIQRLLDLNLLDEYTMLIIDEPEAHLHPQWIVEYAKLIVNLHSLLGVQFMIASHSTDMILALRRLTEKNDDLDRHMKFYLAEESCVGCRKYTYKDCEGDISHIFRVFNKSYDKIKDFAENMTNEDEEVF